MDTLAATISLLPRRRHRLMAILDDLPRTTKRIYVKKWQTILGELCSMSIAIPGLQGLFYLFQ